MKFRSIYIKLAVAFFLFFALVCGCSTQANSTHDMKVLIPAYFFAPSADWDRIYAQAAKMPGRIYAIFGPGDELNPDYSSMVSHMHNSGGRVIGYVDTDYTAKSIDSVEALIDAWYTNFPTIDGIFFDRQSSDPGGEDYYQILYAYVKNKRSSALVIANPGAKTSESYLVYNGGRVSDVLNVFESNSVFANWEPLSWGTQYAADNFCIFSYDTLSTQWISVVNHAVASNVGWIYCTDDSGDNPWDTLPAYFENFCDYVATR